MQATRSSFESVRARKVCDLLVTLKKNNVATNDVEHGIRRSCCKLTCRQQLVVRMDIMRAKIKDAYKDMASKRIENAKIWKECKKVIVGLIRVRYLNKWRESIMNLKQRLVTKNNSKVKWLKSKWKKQAEPEIAKNYGVEVEDCILSEEFNATPRLYGGVLITNEEKKVLSLPPKFGVYNKVTKKCD